MRLVSKILLGSVLILQCMTPEFAHSTPESKNPVLSKQSNLKDYIEWSLQNHPRLQSAAAISEAARQSANEAGALPDLKLAYGEMIVPVETRVGPQERVFSVAQSFPWFGSLGQMEAAANSRRLAAESHWRSESQEIKRLVGQAWYELAQLQQEIKITQSHREISQQNEEVALRAYEAGTAKFRHVLQAQMQSEKLINRVVSLQSRLQPATISLNSAAGMSRNNQTPAAFLPAKVMVPEEAVDYYELMKQNNARLENLRQQEDGFRYSEEAARLSGRPQFTVGLDYIMTGEARMQGVDDSGKDPLIARVAVNVPLWSGKATARRLASASRLNAASSKRTQLNLELEMELEKILFRVGDSTRNLKMYENNLLPRARQVLQASRADYETGNASFDEVNSAREVLLDLELSLLRATLDQALAFNDLQALTGVPQSFKPYQGNE
ncbi:MAG: TolC family protein [bacterium]|nr:TolC family protein [bacterium]